MWSFYGIVVLVLCFSVHQGSCAIEKKPATQPQNSDSNNSGTAQKEGDGEAGVTPVAEETITWPFSEHQYQPGKIQSPINVDTASAVLRHDLQHLKMFHPKNLGCNVECKNSGETVYVYVLGTDRRNLPYLEGGPLQGRFYFEQMHFHWGLRDIKGSEHTIDENSFAIEIHIVYFNGKYADFHEAMKKGDGLAVVSVFAELDDKNNELLSKLETAFPALSAAGSTTSLHWKDGMEWALSGMYTNTEYYTYPGSLTTPPYSQNVAFILLPNPITISHQQIEAFRNLNDENFHHILANKRAPQDLNGRPIFKGYVDQVIDIK